MSALKEKVLELAAIAKECPENLQAICFELLLKNHLESLSPTQQPARSDEIGKSAQRTEKRAPDAKPDQDRKPLTPEESAEGQDDLAESDLHIKARHFMKKYGATIEHLNNLFYKDKGRIESLYEDLKTTRMGEGQIRIALLQALRTAIENGEFQTAVEAVRSEANLRKCYDQANFAANFRNNASLFDFEKYDKTTVTLKLSEAGRKELAEVIKELQ